MVVMDFVKLMTMAQYRADLDVAALKCNLKHVVIEEFKNFLKILERGQMPD
jgi:hypothetical protein